METLINIVIDGKKHSVRSNDNLLAACIALGYDLPYFCYHPAMGSVGACRQCAVKKYKDAGDTTGKIIMACMEPLVDGMIISIEDEEARKFRKSVVEGLMLNHPHDCPVCDEGGECHLQDMTVMTGHSYRRNDFKKRTFNNQYLGSFIHQEMNRCIQCYRCVRFYKDYAGGKDFDVFASRDNVFFGRHEDGVLENEFSGNLIEVCPTGVFTDKTSRKHFTRKWDLTNTPSVCTHCSVGCNIIGSERYGSMRRVMSRYNGAVNGYFLCDRGRFGYEFVNSESRLLNPSVRLSQYAEHENVSASAEDEILDSFINKADKLIGIGSPRASLEANYALMHLVGKENFYSGVSAQEYSLTALAVKLLSSGNYHSPSLSEIARADAIVILGEDVTNTAPMTALAVRQASISGPVQNAVAAGIPDWNDNAVRTYIQSQHSPVINALPFTSKLDDCSTHKYHATPAEIAELGHSIANSVSLPADSQESKPELNEQATIAQLLKQSKNPVIITGVSSGSADIIQAAANLATELSKAGKNTGLCIIVPECNSMGLAMMQAKPLEEAFNYVESYAGVTVVVLENDLYKRSQKEKIDNLIQKSKAVIALDHIQTDTTSKSHVVIPVGTFAESEGTFVNYEGRAQRYYKVIPPGNSPTESWRLLGNWNSLDEVVSGMVNEFPVFSRIRDYMPDADFEMYNEKISRQTKRYSGRTSNGANVNVSEQKPPADPDSPLAFTMEGTVQDIPSSLVPYYWKPGWNSNQAMNFYLDRPDGSMKGGDPGIKLFEMREQSDLISFNQMGDNQTLARDEWLVVPVYQIFGSEELSSLAPAVAERIDYPFVLVNENDLETINKSAGEVLDIKIGDSEIELMIRTDIAIPSKTLAMSVNLPGMEYFELPAKITLTTDKNQ